MRYRFLKRPITVVFGFTKLKRVESEKNHHHTQPLLLLLVLNHHMAKKDPAFWRILLLIAVFYFVPGIQVVTQRLYADNAAGWYVTFAGSESRTNTHNTHQTVVLIINV